MANSGRQTALAVNEEKNLVRGEAALIVALACGDSVKEAAEKAGVGERTVYRRLADQDFMAKVHKARNMMISQAVGKLSLNCAKAAETLEELLKSDNPRIRLQAAKAILDHSIKLSDNWIIELRLSHLEGLLTPLSDKRKEREKQKQKREQARSGR
jgi:DNA-binding NarL/FixJ family response regulator